MEKSERGMRIYILTRLLSMILVFFGIIIFVFLLIHVTPGDPVDVYIGDIGVPQEYADMIREKMGLNQPLPVQLSIYMKNILTGDLGFSFFRSTSVLKLILGRLPYTLLIQSSAFVLSSILGIVLGVLASKKPYSLTDNLLSALSVSGFSIPAFWLGQMLILIFALFLGLFPTSGSQTLRVELSGLAAVGDLLHHAFLPILTTMVWFLALNFRITRSSMLETLKKDFIITARSKGLAERVVLYRHALKNALIPIVTVMGINLGYLISGSVVVESVFAYPGIGLLLWESTLDRDYPTMMGLLIFCSFAVLLANLLIDVLNALIDPRIRYK